MPTWKETRVRDIFSILVEREVGLVMTLRVLASRSEQRKRMESRNS